MKEIDWLGVPGCEHRLKNAVETVARRTCVGNWQGRHVVADITLLDSSERNRMRDISKCCDPNANLVM